MESQHAKMTNEKKNAYTDVTILKKPIKKQNYGEKKTESIELKHTVGTMAQMQHALVAAVTGVVVVEPTSVSLNIDGVKSIFTFCPCPGFHTLTFLHSYSVHSILGVCLWDKNENCAHS